MLMRRFVLGLFLAGCCPDLPGVAVDSDGGNEQTSFDSGYCVDPCWADLSVPLDMSVSVDMCTPDLAEPDDCDDHHRHDDSPGHVKHCGLNHGHRTN
jgi:hypothetical protein